jgi:hypothetical protein
MALTNDAIDHWVRQSPDMERAKVQVGIKDSDKTLQRLH